MGFLSKAHISYIPVKEGRDEFSFLWTNSKRHKKRRKCVCLSLSVSWAKKRPTKTKQAKEVDGEQSG